MAEFKGTSGKWGYELKLSNGYINLLAQNAEIRLAEVIVDQFSQNGETEAYANALLFSKAPEMLEIIEELAENLSIQLGRLGCCGEGDGKDHKADNDSYGGTGLLQRARKLIKEATELN